MLFLCLSRVFSCHGKLERLFLLVKVACLVKMHVVNDIMRLYITIHVFIIWLF
jgi:hypothetical protein